MPSTNIKITATDKSKSAFTSAQRSVNALKGSINMLKGALLGYISIAGAKAFVNFTNQQRDMADTIGKMSTRLGITTTELQKFRFAGELAGESAESMDNNIIKFVRNIGDARVGVKTLTDEFDRLGINLRDANGNWKNHGDVLKEVADKYKTTTDPARKLSSAMTLFGRGGRVMVNMLSGGSEGLEKFGNQLSRAGGIISEDFVQSSEEANDRLSLMGKIMTAISTRSLKPFNKLILDTSDAYLRIKGIDPTADMSLRRLRQVHAELDTAISKTATQQKFWADNIHVTNAVSDEHVQILAKEIYSLSETQNLIEARIKNAVKLTETQKGLSKITENKNKKEEEQIARITILDQKMFASKMSLAFEAHAQSAELAEAEKARNQGVLAAQVATSAKQSELASAEKVIKQEMLSEILGFRRTAEEEETFLIMEEHARRKELINQFFGEEVANHQAKENALVQQRADTAEKLKAIDIAKRDSAINTSKQMLQQMGSANESWFQANKALAISDSIMATYTAATKALAVPPPPVGMAFAALITGLGLANVNRIKNEKFQGRALGGAVNKNQTYMVGERGPELFTPNQSGNITANNKLSGPTNINFNIQANDAKGFDDLLNERRGMIMNMINRSMNEQGQRGLTV